MRKKWTAEEVALLFTNKTSDEIAGITGRTLMAVQHKRYLETGHSEPIWDENTFSIVPPPDFEKKLGIIKIKELAKRIGVKLLGEKA